MEFLDFDDFDPLTDAEAYSSDSLSEPRDPYAPFHFDDYEPGKTEEKSDAWFSELLCNCVNEDIAEMYGKL